MKRTSFYLGVFLSFFLIIQTESNSQEIKVATTKAPYSASVVGNHNVTNISRVQTIITNRITNKVEYKGPPNATYERILKNLLAQDRQKLKEDQQDAALAQFEALFSMAVRMERDIDGTVIHLNGQERQQIISYDQNLKPMQLFWGDKFEYFVFTEQGNLPVPAPMLQLEVVAGDSSYKLPLKIDSYTEQSVRIYGKNPNPMTAYILNSSGLTGVSLKITVYSTDREQGRETFKEALKNTSLRAAARRVYKEVGSDGDGLRLRRSPSEKADVLRSIRAGTYLRVIDLSPDGQWANVRFPEGREGWVMYKYLVPIQ